MHVNPQDAGRAYAARLDIDYPEKLDRVTTLFRLVWVIPIALILGLITATGSTIIVTDTGEEVVTSGGGIVGGLFIATALMILFRQKYPRWWFDFSLELSRFGTRVGAYLALLTDRYPSTDEEQTVHLELDYPDARNELNRWMPIVKTILAIPHYFVLAFLVLGAILAVFIAWFAILFTGRFPRPLFDFVVGVGRWALRVEAYAFLLLTDEYPPFSLS
ncbi:MAG TPA: DUF4389 domain-containing protein [Acidimicrobiia bacterium]